MSTVQPAPKAGDPCPACGGELAPHRVATAEEFAAFIHKEHPVALPPRVDTANPADVAALGALAVCINPACGYRTRIAAPEGDGAPAAAGPGARPRRRRAAPEGDAGRDGAD